MEFRVWNIYYGVSLGPRRLEGWEREQDWKEEDVKLRHRPNKSLGQLHRDLWN